MMSNRSMHYDSRYEAQFAEELLAAVLPGDCVWDVGANIGYFTTRLAERAGASGCVVAFEPFHSTFERLLSATRGAPRVRCLQLALGADEREILAAGTPGSPWNSLADEAQSPASAAERIHVTTGAKLISGGLPPPHVIKIDVEGFEEDVLWGFRDNLRDTCCATIFIEIHYALSERRGMLRAPERVLSMLHDFGFNTRWLDPNHLKATRPRR